MFAPHIKDYIVSAADPVDSLSDRVAGLWGQSVFVVNDDNRYLGRVDLRSLNGARLKGQVTAGELCDRGRPVDNAGNYFQQAESIFLADPHLRALPVVSPGGDIEDLIFRNQTLYKNYLRPYALKTPEILACLNEADLLRLHYAFCIYYAAWEGSALGYERISVIEFGVAGGNGLVQCERFAQAIEKELGIGVEVYGFDNASGLPPLADYRDGGYRWAEGEYPMGEVERLKQRLSRASLVIGDIAEAAESFFRRYNPAPIGAMLIDVDLYHSTVPILNLLTKSHAFFLPRVIMYFDDITWDDEFIGESLAIAQFNEANSDLKISPQQSRPELTVHPRLREFARLKRCHRFSHELYQRKLSRQAGVAPWFFEGFRRFTTSACNLHDVWRARERD